MSNRALGYQVQLWVRADGGLLILQWSVSNGRFDVFECECWFGELSRPIDVPPMLHSVDEYDLFGLEDLVDDPVVAASRRVQPFEFSKQRLAQTSRVPGDWAENCCEGRFSHLLR